MIKLTHNKDTEYSIIYRINASESELTAVNNLKKYLFKITGAILCEYTDNKPDCGKEIIVGYTARGGYDEALKEKLGDEGYCIKTEGDSFVVETLYGEKTIAKADALPERCLSCKSKKHVAYDELLGEDGEVCETNRFDMVEKLEAMSSEERFNFWRGELSRCIRCNACRNVCPACTCERCVFDNDNSGIAQKAAADSFEENMFHIIRAFHVAGRCTDCGECSRVCPQNIPLHLLNRKFIKDINEFYGEFQAGEDTETRAPLNIFDTEDVEPSIVYEKGGN